LQVGLKNIGNRADVTSVPQAGGTINADMIKYKSAAKNKDRQTIKAAEA